jgi:hypothetical protein
MGERSSPLHARREKTEERGATPQMDFLRNHQISEYHPLGALSNFFSAAKGSFRFAFTSELHS